MTAKRDKAEATRLHSLIVRARGACEACGETTNLQCAHIISRRYSRTRTDLSNAFCLCAGCHMRFTEWPLEFGAFVEQKLGAYYYTLQRDALEGGKVDWAFERDRLQTVWKAIEVAA